MDLKGIPDKDFRRLKYYLGEEGAYEYIKKRNYNYQAVITKILILDVKSYLNRKSVIFTILLIIVILLFLILFFEDLIFF